MNNAPQSGWLIIGEFMSDESYLEPFAEVYDLLFGKESEVAFGKIVDKLYSSTGCGKRNKVVLDLGCGTGTLLQWFCENGYKGIGIDASSAMLSRAKAKLQPYLERGQAHLLCADVTSFELTDAMGRPGIVLSSGEVFQLLNATQLQQTIHCALGKMEPDGFIATVFTGISPCISLVRESEDFFCVEQSHCDGIHIDIHRIGFQRTGDGNTYRRWKNVDRLHLHSPLKVAELFRNAGAAGISLSRIDGDNLHPLQPDFADWKAINYAVIASPTITEPLATTGKIKPTP